MREYNAARQAQHAMTCISAELSVSVSAEYCAKYCANTYEFRQTLEYNIDKCKTRARSISPDARIEQ